MAIFNKPRKPTLKKVIQTIDNYEGKRFTVEIDIPNGWSFQCGFAKQSCLIDEFGNVRQTFDVKAGYVENFEFIYEV